MRIDDAIAFEVSVLFGIGGALAVKFAAVALAAFDGEPAVVGILFERGGSDERLVGFDDRDGAGGIAGGDGGLAGMDSADVAVAVDGGDFWVGGFPGDRGGVA